MFIIKEKVTDLNLVLVYELEFTLAFKDAKKIPQEMVDRFPESGYSTKSNKKKKERRQSRCFIYFLVKQQKIRFQIVLSPEDVRCSRADRC